MRLRQGALVSRGEKATAGTLRRYFHGESHLILKDVQLRQVVRADRREFRAGEWDYYRTATLDFLICNDDDDWSHELALEFDGPVHDDPNQKRKDALKNRICSDAGLPLIRISDSEILVREKLTFLEYMLDLYFGEKEIGRLRDRGDLSDADEFFPSFGFSGTDAIENRLLEKHAVVPAVLADSMDRRFAETILWCRSSDVALDGIANSATSRVELMSGIKDPRAVLTVERAATVGPSLNGMGIHGWHLAQELSLFLCFQELERRLDALSRQAG